jgi:uncharacterized membrane protein
MKSMVSIIGLVLVILGIIILAYQGISYTKHETVAQIGNLQVTADTQKTVYFPPIIGGVALIAGIVLVIVGQKRH